MHSLFSVHRDADKSDSDLMVPPTGTPTLSDPRSSVPWHGSCSRSSPHSFHRTAFIGAWLTFPYEQLFAVTLSCK